MPRAENADADALVNRALDGRVAPLSRQPAGGTDYATYLLIDDLLELQRPITPGAHDELLFIVVHQAYELWFKLILHELARGRATSSRRPAARGAPPRLRRVVAIERLLLDQLDVLETMGPEGFLEFRDPLAPASGFQSRQFREIEWLSGERGTWPAAAIRRRRRRSTTLPRRARPAGGARGSPRSPTSTATTPATRCAPPGTTSPSCSLDHDETVAALAPPPHADGGARDRHPAGHRRLARGRVPARRPSTRRFFPELWDVRVAL